MSDRPATYPVRPDRANCASCLVRLPRDARDSWVHAHVGVDYDLLDLWFCSRQCLDAYRAAREIDRENGPPVWTPVPADFGLGLLKDLLAKDDEDEDEREWEYDA